MVKSPRCWRVRSSRGFSPTTGATRFSSCWPRRRSGQSRRTKWRIAATPKTTAIWNWHWLPARPSSCQAMRICWCWTRGEVFGCCGLRSFSKNSGMSGYDPLKQGAPPNAFLDPPHQGPPRPPGAHRPRRPAGRAHQPPGVLRPGRDDLPRARSPNEVVRVEGSLHPRRVADTARVEPSDLSDPRGMPEVMLSNADVSVAVSRRTAAMPYAYRNTDGDLLYFVHKGTGQFATEFGRLVYEPGDYVLIPKGITFSVMPDAGDSQMLVVESPAPLSLTEHQQVGRHMPVDPTVLVLPELHDQHWPQRDEWELRVKHGGTHSSIFYRNNPLVSVGWKGDLFPYKLNIRDIIPISSDRIHVAPSAWCTFQATGFVVITFVPQSRWRT